MRDEKTHGSRATGDSEPKTHLSSHISLFPTTDHELTLRAQGFRAIAGVDEVGRGSWAGPVVAAAVILPDLAPLALSRLNGVRDSKQLTASERDRLAAEIRAVAAAISIGWATHHVIDREGIGVANRRAMLRAIRGLPLPADAVLLDHVRLPECPLPQVSLAHGDALVLSIAAASIIAKVTRDRWMERCALRFSGYGFERHKGYGTAQHRAALASLGISPIHRRSFAPCSGL